MNHSIRFLHLHHLPRLLAAFLVLGAVTLVGAGSAQAHCDTMNGPVVLEAQEALTRGDLAPVLKWVLAEDESEVEDAFARARAVRHISEDVREVADMHFLETVVRLHRMSEGVGYTGIKPATEVAPAVAAADVALETGDVEPLADLLVADLHHALSESFAKAYEARAHPGDSVEAGREYVEAYVVFTHLAEAIEAVTQHVGADAHAHGGHAH